MIDSKNFLERFQLNYNPKNYIKNLKVCSNQNKNSLINSDIKSSNLSSKSSDNIRNNCFDYEKNKKNLNHNNLISNSFPGITFYKKKICKDYSNNLNYEKAKNTLKELNNQITKMNYCNVIQNNSIQRLDLSLSFLSSQIDTLKYLNKKRKMKLQKTIEKIKTNDKYKALYD